MEASIKGPPDPGSPPALAARALQENYAPLDSFMEEEASPIEAPDTAAGPGYLAKPIERKTAETIVMSTDLERGDRRILDRLRDTGPVITIRVNGVELSLDVVDVSRNEHSVCCLIKRSGMRCRIPVSSDVVILLDQEEIDVAYTGAWHTLDWLDVHVVMFLVLPSSTAGQLEASA